MSTSTILAVAAAIALLACLSTYWVASGFFVMSSAKRVLAAGIELPLGIKLSAYWDVARGAAGDFLYNAIVGSIRFREWPQWQKHEWLYSWRVQRLVHEGKPWQVGKALYWANLLNAADPGHIEV